MQSLSKLFLSEFEEMARGLSAMCKSDIYQLSTPDGLCSSEIEKKCEQVTIRGISDDYFSKLNDTFAFLLSRPKLTKRKFNSNGDFVKKQDGTYFTEEVVVPANCLAVLSKTKIGVPLSFSPSEVGMQFVDIFESKLGNERKELYYIYIVPRKFCYKINLCALCLSYNKPVRTYGGCYVYLITGQKVFLYIAPFKITSADRNYRVFTVKTSIDLMNEYKKLLTFWGENGIIYTIDKLWLTEPVNDKQNAGYGVLDKTLDEYIQFDIEHSMESNLTTVEELDILF